MDEAAARRTATTLGKQRARALAQAEEAMQQIRELAPVALDAGMTKREYAALTGISRPTLDALLADDPLPSRACRSRAAR